MSMPLARCFRRLVTSVATAIVLLAVVPGIASAITFSNFALGSGVTSAGAPSGSVAFNSRVTISGLGIAGSFAYSYAPTMSPRTCVNERGTGTKTFDVVFPQPPDVYTIYFQSYFGSNCTGTPNLSTPVHFTNAVRVTSPALNPALKPRCGLNVVLVLDESGSIASTPGATAHVREAATAFVEALSGTGSRAAIVAFSRTARVGVQYDIVNQGSLPTFTNFINTGYHPVNDTAHAGTNWQAAFEEVKALNLARPANLVVFVTDGDPNTFNNSFGGVTTRADEDGTAEAMIPAAAAADGVKAAQSRVFAVGVGAAVNNTHSAARLTAVSGDKKFETGGDFATSDYSLVSDFSELADELRAIVTGACAPSLTITKWVAAPGGTDYTSDAPGWQFTGTLSTSSGSHEWVEPMVSPNNAPSATAITDDDGLAAFKWSLTHPTAHSTLRVVETQMDGYTFVRADCQIRHGATSTDITSTTGIPDITLRPDEFATCSVYNQGPVAHLTVVKHLIPSTDPGRFDLLVDGFPHIEQVGDGGSTGALTLGLGTHMVSERVTAVEEQTVTLDQYAISTSCVDETTGAVVASGIGSEPVSVTLASPSDDIVCTITNERTAEPPPDITPPVTPIVTPESCSDFSSPGVGCAGDVPPPTEPQTSLSVAKRMPAAAHVGDVVPIVITVSNVGTDTAENVTLRDTPPGAGRIVHATGFHATRHKDGTVTWNLGDLAPGATRTVHATMLITNPGSLQNTAIVSASNADVVVDSATVRAVTPTPPPVTG
jgi:uncharacterized repeat protein (TIGR01451 family)